MNISNELNQLEQRRASLHEYLRSDDFKQLPPNVQDWRRMQEGAMEQYSRALVEIQRLAPAGYLDSGNNAPVAASTAQDEVPDNHPARQRQREAVQQAVNDLHQGKPYTKAQLSQKATPKRKAVARKAPVVAAKVVSKAKK